MTEKKSYRTAKVAKDLSVGLSTVVDYLKKQGFEVDSNPNGKITEDMYLLLMKEFKPDADAKIQSNQVVLSHSEKQTITIEDVNKKHVVELEEKGEEEVLIKGLTSSPKLQGPKIVSKINLDDLKKPSKPKEPEKPIEKPVIIPPVTESPAVEVKEEVKVVEPEVQKPIEVKKSEPEHIETKVQESSIKVVGFVDLNKPKKETPAPEIKETVEEIKPIENQTPEIINEPETEQPILPNPKEDVDENFIKTNIPTLKGVTSIGKIDLAPIRKEPDYRKEKEFYKNKNKKNQQKPNNQQSQQSGQKTEQKPNQPNQSNQPNTNRPNIDKSNKPKRNRITPTETTAPVAPAKVPFGEEAKKTAFTKVKDKKKKKNFKIDVDQDLVDQNIRSTNAALFHKEKSKSAKYRKEKRGQVSQRAQEEQERLDSESKVIKINEFLTVNELANMMHVPVTNVITLCMNIGLFVSINQRLDADNVSLIADEFGYSVEFIHAEKEEKNDDEIDSPESLVERPPIVTVMGHVDHGKTKLLDFVRNANVIAGEAGGITQHIGAYNVTLENGKQITFLDTPGHEAFTAMRARGAKVTDIAIIVVAADDGIMPQTIEAINHAQAAGVKLIFAINKIDKPEANPERIKEQLANMNLLVEDWGGKYQSQEISAKQGLNVALLLEKVLLEAELLELKANPNRRAIGSVLESALDKGRGYITTLLIHTGTLKIGDIIVVGPHFGRVKAMFNERNQRITEAGPSMPVQILGLNGAPQAGDSVKCYATEHEAKEIANKRMQIIREQGIRTQKHITLEEIGRRISVGNFKEINIIVKGDVDGSIEALGDSLIKLSNEEIQVNVIHKAVGQISDSDIMLAAASNAIIIGFQVRPSTSARKLAEREEIQIRLYSIIYDAIEEIKLAMEGMLSPEIKEEIIGTAEVLEAFHISKVGTIAGCRVTDGKILRSAKVRLIRDGIVAYTGNLGSLKRFKDDAREVTVGLECGLNIDGFNDIKAGDIIESFQEKEVKKKL